MSYVIRIRANITRSVALIIFEEAKKLGIFSKASQINKRYTEPECAGELVGYAYLKEGASVCGHNSVGKSDSVIDLRDVL